MSTNPATVRPGEGADRREARPTRRRWPQVAVGGALFLFALALRLTFFCGFVLGDDLVEFATAQGVLDTGPKWADQLHLRFGGWLFNVAAFALFGVSEATFFLPTVLISASFAVIAYAMLGTAGYGMGQAALGGALVASAPFEVLIGCVRANDLILAWVVALGCLVLLRFERRPVIAGALLAVCFWFGFYVKLWAVYFIPPLALYYVARRDWTGAASFAIASTVLHGATLLLWKVRLGSFVPFIDTHAATYPVTPGNLGTTLWEYPKLLFVGSGLGTTLFGVVPFALGALVLAKVAWRWVPSQSRWRRGRDFARWDRLDVLLLVVYGVFFVLLEFVPNGFRLDQYYSVPRIFRYLTPLSFAMTLHTAKLAIDAITAAAPARHGVLVASFLGLIAVNLVQAARATEPGRAYRTTLLAVRDDIAREAPPLVVAELVVSEWLRRVLLSGDRVGTVLTPYHTYAARDYETWLEANQSRFPPGSMLISGLCSYVFYGAFNDGFRLRLFAHPLAPEWELFKDYGSISHLPDPVQVWRLSRSPPPSAAAAATAPPTPSGQTAEELLRSGMRHFDKHELTPARALFKAAIDRFPDGAEDARYFYAVTLFREQRWDEALAAFQDLIRAHPDGHWVAAAHYHLGRCKLELWRLDEARAEFQHVLDQFPGDTNTRAMARDALAEISGRRRGLIPRLLDSVQR